ncbi:hypothetical protein INT47_009236 [Mucor saturninus]|uniref:Uncharacterized protein n=1 Tax=Mucor saturninus TaxID=64648 RepID=A0A8H7UNJ8_9FUNG|nr:hypothetical protein INT47_009236 [Mucor saturninus]
MAPRSTPTSRSTDEQLQLLETLRDIQNILVRVDSRIGTSIEGNASTVEAIDSLAELVAANNSAVPAAELASAFGEELFTIVGPAPGPVAIPATGPAPIIPAVVEYNPGAATEAFRHIRDYLWRPNFRSNNPAMVQANNNRPRWRTEVHFNESPNKELVLELLAYLGPTFINTGLRQRDLWDSVYRNFCRRRRQERASPEARVAANARARKAGREADHFHRRRMAYLSNKDAIDNAIGNDCSALIQKAAMSEGESEDEFPGVPGWRMIRTVRPGWRSDEFNQLIELLDSYSLLGLGVNVRQMLPRVFGRVADLAVPEGTGKIYANHGNNRCWLLGYYVT